MRPAFLLLALLCVLAPHPARADTPAQVQKAIQAICDRRRQGYFHNNLNEFNSGYARNYTQTDVVGHRDSLAHMRAYDAQELARHYLHPVLVFKIGLVTLRGNTAQAREETHRDFVVPPFHNYGKYHYHHDTIRSTTWVKVPTGWQETACQVLYDVLTYSR